jgi:nitrate/nitrite transporter NarK
MGWQSDQWRVVFVAYGGLGVAWAAAFVWHFRDQPAHHPRCNAAEVELIAEGPSLASGSPAMAGPVGWFCALFCGATVGWILAVSWLTDFVRTKFGERLAEWITNLAGTHYDGSAIASALVSAVPVVAGLCGTLLLAAATNRLLLRFAPTANQRLALPLTAMLVSKEMWLMCAINFLVNVGWIFLATWLPQYLIDRHGPYLKGHIGDERLVAALITAVVGLAAIGGGLLGGRATDVFARRFGGAWGRRLPGMIAGVLVCAMYLVVPQLAGLWPFVGAMIAIAFVIDFGLGATWASNQDIGGRHVAAILGCGNMCGNLGAAYFGERIGYLADRNQWDSVFYIAAGAMLLAACCWFLFDATRPVVRDAA